MRLRTEDACPGCSLGSAAAPAPCPFHEIQRGPGTPLLVQGEVPHDVWYLRQGLVLLSSVSAGGDETSCLLRRPGGLLGLEALRNRPVDYDAWSLTDVVLCRIDTDAFRAWVNPAAPTPLAAVLDLALDELGRRGQERMAVSGRAVSRVARVLLERAKHGIDAPPLEVEQQILARMLGMRAETLSRALHRLRSDGVVAPGRKLQVLDLDRLRRIAGEVDGVAEE